MGYNLFKLAIKKINKKKDKNYEYETAAKKDIIDYKVKDSKKERVENGICKSYNLNNIEEKPVDIITFEEESISLRDDEKIFYKDMFNSLIEFELINNKLEINKIQQIVLEYYNNRNFILFEVDPKFYNIVPILPFIILFYKFYTIKFLVKNNKLQINEIDMNNNNTNEFCTKHLLNLKNGLVFYKLELFSKQYSKNCLSYRLIYESYDYKDIFLTFLFSTNKNYDVRLFKSDTNDVCTQNDENVPMVKNLYQALNSTIDNFFVFNFFLTNNI